MHKDRMRRLYENLDKLHAKRKATVLIVLISVSSFVGSMASALVAMNVENLSSRYLLIYFCMLLLLAGMVFLFISIINYAYPE